MIRELLRKILYISRLEDIELYLVGGFIRDLIQGENREALDIDFILKGENPNSFLQRITSELKGTLVVLDEKNKVYRVVVKIKELKKYLDFSVMQGNNLEEDLRGRDFTINSIAIKLGDYINKPLDKEIIIDPTGGIKDLEKGLIKEVSPRVFEEDPLRLLRGVRFCAQLNFDLEDKTKKNIIKNNSLIKVVSGERIREELWNILDEDNSYPWIYLLEEDLRILTRLFSDVENMRLTEQNFYHGENVWRHCLRTYRYMEKFINEPPFTKDLSLQLNKRLEEEIIPGRKRKHLLKLFALFHDAGKVSTQKTLDSGRTTFFGHEKAGVEIMEKIGKRLKLSSKEISVLMSLMKHHMRPLFLYMVKNLKPRTCYRFFRKVGRESPEVLFHSAVDFISKRKAKGQGEGEFNDYRRFLQQLLKKYFYEEERYVNPLPLVNGRDLMKDLNLKPSPALGYILDKISEAQAEGRVKNRKEAIQFASELAKGKNLEKRFGKIL